MTVDPNGPVCPCGNHGCFGVMAAGPAIAAAAIRAVSTGSSTLIRDLVNGKIEAITAEVVSQAAAKEASSVGAAALVFEEMLAVGNISHLVGSQDTQ